MTLEVNVLLALFIKHFICDFPLQHSAWMYRNKGTYGHPGGLAHSGVHYVGTTLVFTAMLFHAGWSNADIVHVAAKMAVFDLIIHYHVDWAKMNIGAYFDLRPDNSNWFWTLLGVDQLLHALTYFAMIYLVF